MCNYQPWEDDSPQNQDYTRSTENGINRVEARWETRMTMLEARIARVEARVDRFEEKMLFLQKGMRVVCLLFLVTLVYAIWK